MENVQQKFRTKKNNTLNEFSFPLNKKHKNTVRIKSH